MSRKTVVQAHEGKLIGKAKTGMFLILLANLLRAILWDKTYNPSAKIYQLNGELNLRKAEDLPPTSIRFDSPYDPEAHYSTKRQTHWTGYKVHLTESCDDD